MSGLLWGVQACWNSKQYLLVSKWAEVESGNSVLTITPHASEPDSFGRSPKYKHLRYLRIPNLDKFFIWTGLCVTGDWWTVFLGHVSVGHCSGTR